MHQEFQNSRVQGWPEQERRANDKTDLIISQLSDMKEGISALRDNVADLAKQMTRLAIAEERIGQVNEALGRSFKALEKVEARVNKLEEAAPLNNQARVWVFAVIAAVIGAAAVHWLPK